MMVAVRPSILLSVPIQVPRPSNLLSLASIKASLQRAEILLSSRKQVVQLKAPVVKVVPPTPAVATVVLVRQNVPLVPFVVRATRDEELLRQEINGCKSLLLEIIRRAAYDWVLYRTSQRMVQKVLADQAFRWLFTEQPGSGDWEERVREQRHITSFEAICESLDLDPNTVRNHVRRLTPKNVMSVGRPAEYRRRDVFSANSTDEDVYSLPDSIVPYTDDSPDDGSTL